MGRRCNEYGRLKGQDRAYSKGQKYIASLLNESFGQLWDYEKAGWARKFFDNWTFLAERAFPSGVCIHAALKGWEIEAKIFVNGNNYGRE